MKDFIQLLKSDLKFSWMHQIQLKTILIMLLTVFPMVIMLPLIVELMESNTLLFLNDTPLRTLLENRTMSGLLSIISSSFIMFLIIYFSIIFTNIIVDEISSKSWLLWLNVGYSKTTLILSKIAAFSTPAAVSVSLGYLLVYFLLQGYEIDITLNFVLIRAAILFIVIFLIVTTTILLSMAIKNKAWVISTVISFFIFLPDLMNFFSFYRYLPTYAIAFIFSNDEFNEFVFIAIGTLVALNGLTWLWVNVSPLFYRSQK